jgi:hypothetical protein
MSKVDAKSWVAFFAPPNLQFGPRLSNSGGPITESPPLYVIRWHAASKASIKQ